MTTLVILLLDVRFLMPSPAPCQSPLKIFTAMLITPFITSSVFFITVDINVKELVITFTILSPH